MAADDDLEPRVNALENEVRDLKGRIQGNERDAAAARILAGAADRDVSEFRTEMRGLRGDMNDLRTELRGEMSELRDEMQDFRNATTASFNAQRQDFVDLRDHVDRGFAEMRGKFDGTAAGLQQITQLLQTVIEDRPQK